MTSSGSGFRACRNQRQSASGTSDRKSALSLINAHRREINRIRGYKVELSLAEKQKLSELQADIQKIEAKVTSGTVRADELEDRAEMPLRFDPLLA